MSPLRLLLVEDSENDSLLLLRELRRGGYQPTWERVETLEALKNALSQSEWDLVICDYTLPDFSGTDALHLLKEIRVDLPFLIVSGTINEEMAVAAMKAGAHDYLMKNNLARLVPAVERELREAAVRHSRRLAEEQIREQAALLDVAQDAILVLNLQDRICFWNQSAERLYGWAKEEVVGSKAARVLFATTPSEYAIARKTLMAKGEWQGEFNQFTKAKKAITVESRWKLLKNQQGEPQSLLVVNTDITEKKQIQAQFLRAQRLESIGTLAGGIAHDLNNVLAPILMGVDILRMRCADEKSNKVLDTIEVSAQRGADIVRQVLTFARGLDGNRGDLQIRHLIREIVQMARETFPKSIQILPDTPADLWIVYGDATQLQQVLLNLCVNARDAMPAGGSLKIKGENVWLGETGDSLRESNSLIPPGTQQALSAHPDAKPGSYVLLTVSDTGTGIAPDLLEEIFEPFFTTKPIGQGTGLGLSTVRAIVNSHGGFIQVESELGKGTRFKIYLPAEATAQVQLDEREAEELLSGNGELVLVVDDEASIRDIARQTLEAFGYRVLTAEDGTEAVTLYAQHCPEVLVAIVDMKMPILDGRATINALRKIDSKLKIIPASGVTSDDRADDLQGFDARSVLEKPYTAAHLLRTLSRVLRADSPHVAGECNSSA